MADSYADYTYLWLEYTPPFTVLRMSNKVDVCFCSSLDLIRSHFINPQKEGDSIIGYKDTQ